MSTLSQPTSLSVCHPLTVCLNTLHKNLSDTLTPIIHLNKISTQIKNSGDNTEQTNLDVWQMPWLYQAMCRWRQSQLSLLETFHQGLSRLCHQQSAPGWVLQQHKQSRCSVFYSGCKRHSAHLCCCSTITAGHWPCSRVSECMQAYIAFSAGNSRRLERTI